jgi:hypothetical protein
MVIAFSPATVSFLKKRQFMIVLIIVGAREKFREGGRKVRTTKVTTVARVFSLSPGGWAEFRNK